MNLSSFALRFIALYAILLVSSSALNEVTVNYLRAVGTVFYGGFNNLRELDFQSFSTKTHSHEMRVIIANRSLMNGDGSGPVRTLDFDAPGLVIRPLALMVALIFCTPVSWKRRLKALLSCVVFHQLLIVGVLGFCIWHESSEISLVTLSPLANRVAPSIREMLVAQLDLAIPILLWIVVMFRRGDEPLLALLPRWRMAS